jgi:hypothetical protein
MPHAPKRGVPQNTSKAAKPSETTNVVPQRRAAATTPTAPAAPVSTDRANVLTAVARARAGRPHAPTFFGFLSAVLLAALAAISYHARGARAASLPCAALALVLAQPHAAHVTRGTWAAASAHARAWAARHARADGHAPPRGMRPRQRTRHAPGGREQHAAAHARRVHEKELRDAGALRRAAARHAVACHALRALVSLAAAWSAFRPAPTSLGLTLLLGALLAATHTGLPCHAALRGAPRALRRLAHALCTLACAAALVTVGHAHNRAHRRGHAGLAFFAALLACRPWACTTMHTAWRALTTGLTRFGVGLRLVRATLALPTREARACAMLYCITPAFEAYIFASTAITTYLTTYLTPPHGDCSSVARLLLRRTAAWLSSSLLHVLCCAALACCIVTFGATIKAEQASAHATYMAGVFTSRMPPHATAAATACAARMHAAVLTNVLSFDFPAIRPALTAHAIVLQAVAYALASTAALHRYLSWRFDVWPHRRPHQRRGPGRARPLDAPRRREGRKAFPAPPLGGPDRGHHRRASAARPRHPPHDPRAADN